MSDKPQDEKHKPIEQPAPVEPSIPDKADPALVSVTRKSLDFPKTTQIPEKHDSKLVSKITYGEKVTKTSK